MGFQNQVVNVIFKFLKIFKDMAVIIKIAKSIKADVPKKKNQMTPHNKVVSAQIRFEAKNAKKLGHYTNTKIS